MIKIEINDTEVQATFKRLLDAGSDLEPDVPRASGDEPVMLSR